jgi:hypothetical protein
MGALESIEKYRSKIFEASFEYFIPESHVINFFPNITQLYLSNNGWQTIEGKT